MNSRNVLIVTLAVILLAVSTDPSVAEPFVRRATGVPEGHYYWALSRTESIIYAVDIYGNRYDLRYRPIPRTRTLRDMETAYSVVCVDSREEKVVDTFVVGADFWPDENGLFLQAWHKRTYPHLVSNYDFWLSAPAGDVVYAMKPATNLRMTYERWREVHVVESHTGTILHTVQMPEGYIQCIRLSPDGRLLAVANEQQIRLYQAPDMRLVATLQIPGDAPIVRMAFSADGKRLFVFGECRGLVVVDVERKRFEAVSNEVSAGQPMTFGLPYLQMMSFALSPDEKEMYFALTRTKWEKDTDRPLDGRVAAVDVSSGKVVRLLRLSDTGCTSIVVVGNKLFAACLDGIYVIDIDAWRKNPNYQPPWVKQEGK